MKTFLDERVLDEVLQKKLYAILSEVEDGYFAGNLTAEKAKQKLNSFK
jgi:ketol-acid reductoisomerase